MLSFAVFVCLAAAATAFIDPRSNIDIVGGQDADVNEWPWQISLERDPLLGSWYHTCGGSVYNNQWIICAAHCVNTRADQPEVYRVRVGAHDISNDISAEAGSAYYYVSAIFYHNGYSSNTMDNDIALLKLINPITNFGSQYVQGVSLPDMNIAEPVAGTKCWVTGWGDQETVITSTILQEVDVPVIENNECNTVNYVDEVTPNMICAGYPNGGKDSCQGDSGGPFVCATGPSGEFELRGIVSWGYGCADAGDPGVYTNVANYVTWISDTIAAN